MFAIRLISSIPMAVVVACALFGALHASAQTLRTTDCNSKWENSSASDYCSANTVTWISSSTVSWQNQTCHVNASCSLSVTLDGEATTVDGTFTGYHRNPSVFVLCFHQEGSRWRLEMKAGCNSPGISASEAVEDGLTSAD